MLRRFIFTLDVERENLTDSDFDLLFEDFMDLKDLFTVKYPIERAFIEVKRNVEMEEGLLVDGVPVKGIPKVKMELEDKVNSPKHYSKRYSKEVIDSIQALSTPDEYRGYLKGNIIKYTARYQDKGGIEDLQKANWYNNALIKFEKEC